MAINTRYLQEAFSQFELLEEEAFDLGPEGSPEAKEFMDNDQYIDFTDVIDDEAETEEELEDSYDGKVVLDCSVCHSKLFKNPDEIKYDEEGGEEEDSLVNVGEECPFCYSVDGFKIIGQIEPFVKDADFSEEEPEEDDDDEEVEVDDEYGDLAPEDEEVEEALTEAKNLTNIKGTAGNALIDAKERLSACRSKQDVIDLINEVVPDGSYKKKILLNMQKKKNYVDALTYAYNIILKGEDTNRKIDKNESLEESLYDKLKALKFEGKKRVGKKVEENLEECDEADKAEEIEESYSGSVKDWLADHEQAVEDIENHFEKALEDISEEDVINWIGEHDTLYDDYVKAFGLEESLYDKLKALKLEGVDEAYEPGVDEIIEDVEEEEEADSDVANALHDLLNDESEAIQGYNDAADDMEGYPELQKLTKDIAGEEYAHMGEIQQALKSTVAPEAAEIEAGEEEAKEMIAPLESETVDEINSSNEEEIEEPIEDEEEIEEPIEDEEEYVDTDMDEFDEEEFDDLGESYLKNVYENVNSFKTSNVEMTDNDLIVEGLITFNSGNTKTTSFKFSPKDTDRIGRIRFIGENMQITAGKNAFALIGKIKNNKFISESLDYNYRAGKQVIKGKIKK